MKPNTNIRLTIVAALVLLTAALPPVGAFGATAPPGYLFSTVNPRIWELAPNLTQIFSDGLVRPRGLAFDGSGNLFGTTLDTSDLGDDQGQILQFDSNGTPTRFAGGPTNPLANPQQLVFDSAGNMYAPSGGVGNSGAGDPTCVVYKIDPDPNRNVTPFATIGDPNDGKFHELFGAAFDVHGTLFVADAYGTIYAIPSPSPGVSPSPSPFATVGTGDYRSPIGLAFDAAGNLFVSTTNTGGGVIFKISPNGMQQTIYADLSTYTPAPETDLRGLAFDTQGNLFVAGHGTGNLYEVSPGPTPAVSLRQSFVAGQWLAFEPGSDTRTIMGSNVTNLGAIGFATITVNSSVTAEGTTTVRPIPPSSAGMLPSAFDLAGTNLAFDITTTATFATPIIVGFQVPSSLDVTTLTVWHNEDGTLVNATCPNPRPGPTPDTTNNIIYASVNSFSPFVVAKLKFHAQVQQPINADGSSVFSVRRGVVPVKFTLTQDGASTCTLSPATIAVTRTAGGTIGAIDESLYSGSADTGSNFRIDNCRYVYNLSASALGVGTYRVDIKINGTVVGSGVFGLK